MPTKHPRINITLSEDTAELLESLAHKKDQSVASLAKELLMEALERHEDRVLSAVAEARDHVKAKRVKHKDAWK